MSSILIYTSMWLWLSKELSHFVNFLAAHFGHVPNLLGHLVAIAEDMPLFLFHFDPVPSPFVHLLMLQADLFCNFLHELTWPVVCADVESHQCLVLFRALHDVWPLVFFIFFHSLGALGDLLDENLIIAVRVQVLRWLFWGWVLLLRPWFEFQVWLGLLSSN